MHSPVTPASNWYSGGVMLYEALTGRVPYEGSTRRVLTAKTEGAPINPIENADAPEDLAALAIALLNRDQEKRPGAAEVLNCLGLVLSR